MQMYSDLTKTLEDRNVLILYNGANLHPEFVRSIRSVLKVYTCGDPESAHILSEPLAPAFDIHFVNQMSEVERFKSWGLSKVKFMPLGSIATEDDVCDVSDYQIRDKSARSIPIILCCEYSPWRREKLDVLSRSFPEAFIAGKGWPRGIISNEEMQVRYKASRIGWNIHNSTGFNFRTYELAAHGVMQLCDNKSDLPCIFNVGREVVGFDSLAECIELTRYYLAHPAEQQEIAVTGWRRWRADYTPDAVWERLTKDIEAEFVLRRQDVVVTKQEVFHIELKLRRHVRAVRPREMIRHLIRCGLDRFPRIKDALRRVRHLLVAQVCNKP